MLIKKEENRKEGENGDYFGFGDSNHSGRGGGKLYLDKVS
jgi:hypothetical protein